MSKRGILVVMLMLAAGLFVNPGNAVADFHEDFEGPQIDLSNWTISNYGGLNGTQAAGKLMVNGTYDPNETAPGTLGWNQYRLIYKENYTGFLDISVTNTIMSYTGDEFGIGLGILQDPNVVSDNITSWVQNYLFGVGSKGKMESWHNGSVVRIFMDPRNVTLGQSHTHRMIVYDNKSVQFLLDGETKGWWNISYPVFYPFLFVGIHFVGTSIDAELDDFYVITDAIPKAVLDAYKTNLDVDELVEFDGLGSSYVVGSIEAYFFDFGNTVVTGWIDSPTVNYAYFAEGTYEARLRVRADNGKISNWTSLTICVDCAIPVAQLSANVSEVLTLESVSFSAAASSDEDGTIIGYYFDFSDGATSGWIMSPYVNHSFDVAGPHSAWVKVLDDDGHESNWSALARVDVNNRPPVAILTASALEAFVGDMICFNGSLSYDLDGSIVYYAFNSGDGIYTGHQYGMMKCFEYKKAGTYDVTLEVTDNRGYYSELAQVTIVVREKYELDVLISFIAVIILLLIVLLVVAYIALQQRKMLSQEKEAEESIEVEETESESG